MDSNNLVGHAYSWVLNTHVAMLLLENTRSGQVESPADKKRSSISLHLR
jgi:hypothetical protein